MGFYTNTLECGCITTVSTLDYPPQTVVSKYCNMHSINESEMIDGEKEVKDLSNKILKLKRELSHLENIYNNKLNAFQSSCGVKGHTFVSELDGDYHNSKHIYTCTRCEYFTRYKPL